MIKKKKKKKKRGGALAVREETGPTRRRPSSQQEPNTVCRGKSARCAQKKKKNQRLYPAVNRCFLGWGKKKPDSTTFGEKRNRVGL